MMSAEAVMQTLESLGSEQARKTYGRHGVKGPLYGVSYADLTKLTKKIKTDHSLAQALWLSKNHDALCAIMSETTSPAKFKVELRAENRETAPCYRM